MTLATPPSTEQPANPKPPWLTRQRALIITAGVVAVLLCVVLGAWVLSSAFHGDTADSDEHTVSAGIGDRQEAVFDLASGASGVHLTVEDLGDTLYEVSTPDDSGIKPRVDESDDRLKVFGESTGLAGANVYTVRLSDKVTWRLLFSGGYTDVTADLSRARVASVGFTSGISNIELTLPRPSGVIEVKMLGGASQFVVHAPEGVPARVSAGGGAGSVTVDGVTHNGVEGGASFAPDGFDGAADRIDIVCSAGMSTFVLDRGK